MQAQSIADSVFCGISLACSVLQCILIVYLVKRDGWVFSIFLQLNLAMAIVITLNRSISYLDIFFTSIPPHIQQSQVFVRIMYGFMDISFLPFAYFFLITAFSIDLLLNFALHYRSARRLHRWYISMSLAISCVISLPILAWPGRLGQNHLYIVSGSWAQQHYHIITLSTVIVICSLASVALVGAGFWRTIREWRSLRREIVELVLPMSNNSSHSLDASAICTAAAADSQWTTPRGLAASIATAIPVTESSGGHSHPRRGSVAMPCSSDSLDRLYYGRKVSRSIYYLAMYPLINLLAHLSTGVGQIAVYAYPDEKWSRSMRDFTNDSVGILLLIVFISNPAFVESKFRRRYPTSL
ncbi:hypothetical protein GGI04_000587 [Coemansia thaxteri]|uniref:G protein-coupled receptor n=1 Tax=Coemansia thaxteri TaxID=2663907 RepID=A0A9W8BN54_9FUNG|nr:hypothetical protein H4R26_000874 [Coemansia thaxteri]KAJ2009284.1 hypothetical protein GGI04_000587 [Coemansia thaxteri]KAJ2465899.1 hypothetical protein GGI02_004550 [Coemansia sp. RSA 2322]KAJ2487149.1 hypothetical protein EV174_000691 [Coemansia sp. RSA 2320]